MLLFLNHSGCRTKGAALCFSMEFIALKPACASCGEVNPQLKKNPNTTCVVLDGGCICVNPDHCISGNCQFCCIDQRCAFPPGGKDSDVPCVIAVLGCTCCYMCKCKPACCSTLGALKTSVEDAGAPATAISDDDLDKALGAAPAELEMESRQ